MIRTLLVLFVAALFVLALWGMRVGWRHRMERQSGLPDLPVPPLDLGRELLAPSTGLYVGSAFAASWQDRVVVGGLGLRSSAGAALYEAGALITRSGREPLFVPAALMVGARLAEGLAGKVVGAGGLLVIRWRLGEVEIDSGFRADDKHCYVQWIRTINHNVGAAAS